MRQVSDVERNAFFDATSELLRPPVTKNGARAPKKNSHYRAGQFSTYVDIGIDAALDGTMRVHLYSDDVRRHLSLRRLDAEVRSGRLFGPVESVIPSCREGSHESAQRLYFGFNWCRKRPYADELVWVALFVGWFAALKGHLELKGHLD